MKPIPKGYSAGQWHEGESLDVRVFTDGRDTYPNNFVCYVVIRDRKTGVKSVRRGEGRFIGNFSPIWINWQGKKVTVESLLHDLDFRPIADAIEKDKGLD